MQDRSRKQRKRNRTMRQARSLVLFVIVLAFVFGWGPMMTFIRPMIGLGNAKLERIVAIPFAGTDTNGFNSVYIIDDRLCILEMDKVSVFNSLGEFIRDEGFKAEKPVIKDNGSEILLGDLHLGEYIILNEQGEVQQSSHDLGKLDDLWLTTDQSIIALKDGRQEIALMSPQLESPVSIQIPYGKIIDISYSEADQRMAVMVLETHETPYKSSIYQYSITGDLIGVTNFDESIIYDAQYDADGLIVISDHQISAVDSFAEVSWEKDVDGIVNKFTWNPKSIVLNTILTEETIIDTAQTNRLEFYSWSGDLVNAYEIDMDVEGMNAEHNQYLVCFGKQELMLISKKGEILLQKTMRSPVQKVEWISKNRLAIVYNNEVELMDLTY